MRILRPEDFTTQRWKNGGGVTHEVAREELPTADAPGAKMVWRLSIADVASDGPFSLFPGYSRVLTVLEGPGMDLEHDGASIQAMPLRPVAFSGDWNIEGRLVGGRPVRDFNLIFDPLRCDGSVVPVDEESAVPHCCPPVPGRTYALLCVSGATAAAADRDLFVPPLRPGEVALSDSFPAPLSPIPGFRALLVILDRKG